MTYAYSHVAGNEVKVQASPFKLLKVVDGSHDTSPLAGHVISTHTEIAHVLTETVHLRGWSVGHVISLAKSCDLLTTSSLRYLVDEA